MHAKQTVGGNSRVNVGRILAACMVAACSGCALPPERPAAPSKVVLTVHTEEGVTPPDHWHSCLFVQASDKRILASEVDAPHGFIFTVGAGVFLADVEITAPGFEPKTEHLYLNPGSLSNSDVFMRETADVKRARLKLADARRQRSYVEAKPELEARIRDAILAGKICVGMTPEDAQASWGSAPRSSYSGGVGGSTETYRFPSYELVFLDGKLVQWYSH